MDDGTRKYVYGLGLAYAINGSTLEVYHADRLGSIRAISDGSGLATATYRTEEWGTATAQTGSSTQPFGFTGEPRDATGLSYLRARYYDPSLGRFLTRDRVIGNPRSCQTLNRYLYARNNPATLIDPSGLDPLGDTLVVAAKCSFATLAWVEEAATGLTAAAAAAGFVGGGELVPGANVALLGTAAFGASTFVYNLPYTYETINYCFGGPAPTSSSTLFLPPNFPPPIVPR